MHHECIRCGGNGYYGRIGLYEIMPITPKLRKTISKGETADVIEKQALQEGMKTLRMGAIDYVLEGITTIEEMKRITYEE